MDVYLLLPLWKGHQLYVYEYNEGIKDFHCLKLSDSVREGDEGT